MRHKPRVDVFDAVIRHVTEYIMQIMHDNDVTFFCRPEAATDSMDGCSEGGGNATVCVSIPSQTTFIPIARQTVDALSEQLHLSTGDRAAVKLAVGEACNNAVLHSPLPHHPGVLPTVSVACRVFPDALEIDVCNEGNGFHPTPGAKMPTAELLSEHGRGMALMEMMMDSVEYLSVNGNTVVRMRKNRPLLAH